MKVLGSLENVPTAANPVDLHGNPVWVRMFNPVGRYF